jgi:hypothetical protein
MDFVSKMMELTDKNRRATRADNRHRKKTWCSFVLF